MKKFSIGDKVGMWVNSLSLYMIGTIIDRKSNFWGDSNDLYVVDFNEKLLKVMGHEIILLKDIPEDADKI